MNNVDLSNLNNSQQSALKQIDGAVMVLAGAGSGKTRLITYRIAYLISQLNVKPENILAITFTNKAANEMKERLSKMVDSAADIWVSTFHSMCVKILRRHITSLKSAKNALNQVNFNNNFSIYTDTEKDRALKTVLENLKINKENFLNIVSYHISNAKNNNLSPWDYQKLNQGERDIDEITKVYSAYQNYLAVNNALDFDDLLTKTYELFKEFPDILKRYQDKFEFIHIDEFQDTNYIQYEIAKLLAGVHKNIFVVGDEDQCIYSWRGANIQNVRNFLKDFDDCKLMKLEQNYRSTKQILTLANKLITNNISRNEKTLWTDNSIGVKTQYFNAENEFDEAEYVAGQIKTLVRSGDYNYSDFAVLTRLNAMSATFEEKFLNYNIPYRVFGGNKFFDRLEIKNLIAYLKMLANPYDSTSFVRIINYPKRGIGEATVEKILKLTEFHKTTAFNLILNSEEFLLDTALENKIKPFKDVCVSLNNNYEKLSPLEFIDFLIKTINFKSIYSTNLEEDKSRLLNVDHFYILAQEFFNNNPKYTLSEFLQSITLISDIDEYDDKNNTVTLATVHAVKGLEFKVVFICGLEEKMFPIARNYSESDMEEERRLMFVAITRAQQRLYLTNSKSRFMYGKRDYLIPSRFLKECEVISTKPISSSLETNALNTNFPSFSNKVSYSLNKNPNFETKTKEDFSKKYFVGAHVFHPKFGKGIITQNVGINITKCVSIKFEEFGLKTLSIEYAPITLEK